MNDEQKKQTTQLLRSLRDHSARNYISAHAYNMGLNVLCWLMIAFAALFALVGIFTHGWQEALIFLLSVVLAILGVVGLCNGDNAGEYSKPKWYKPVISSEELQLRILKFGLEELQPVTEPEEEEKPAPPAKTQELNAQPEEGAEAKEQTWPDSELEGVDTAQAASDEVREVIPY